MKEATEQVVAEAPKTGKVKQGNKAEKSEKTSVEGAEKKDRAPRVSSKAKYRIFAGVDANKWRGQRQIVVKALQSLGDGAFTAEEIAAKCEGLVSKTPILASTTFHLKGLVADKQIEVIEPEPEKTEEKAAA